MKHLFNHPSWVLICLLSLFTLEVQAQTPRLGRSACNNRNAEPSNTPDLRSDSIDLLNTHLFIDINSATQHLQGLAHIRFVPLLDGVQELQLDLMKFTVDSVKILGPGISSEQFFYNDTLLRMPYPTAPVGDSLDAWIYYHGKGFADISGWGGVYWQGDYAYNLGVGFGADPHSFGRAWFPCFDNFVERCTFHFDITTAANRPAYCNGYLVSEDTLANGRLLRKWRIADAIPSYLACVASGPYLSFQRSYNALNGPLPLQIAVAAADTNKLRNSFAHLPDALACYEYWYGPYRWNKIGYSIVPFTGGAMEHATNIAYPRLYVDGTLSGETLMAHEFSHHWWGDLATCSTAGDMWLNEGWASYSEQLFTEWVYGREAYLSAVESNFLDVLQTAHIDEGGYRPLINMPHEYTYGTTVYDKGAVVAHNLRAYMGDSLFRAGIQSAMEQYQFDSWNSNDLRDALEVATGLDLHPFFNDWVDQGGFTHFSVDSFSIQSPIIDTFSIVQVFVKQKIRGADHFYEDVPLEICFVDAQGNRLYKTGVVSGQATILNFHFPLNFTPVYVWANTRVLLTLARADKERAVKSAGSYGFSPTLFNLNSPALADTLLLRVEHHWAMPDTAGTANPNQYKLSNRYWSVYGNIPSNFSGVASVFYNGKGTLDQLDAELFQQTGTSEDSVLLLYRPGPGYPWQEHPNYFVNKLNSNNDAYGLIRIDQVLAGEYTIGKGAHITAITQPNQNKFDIKLIPNPGIDVTSLISQAPLESLVLVDAMGNILQSCSCQGALEHEIQINLLPSGPYWLIVQTKMGRTAIPFLKL